MSRIGNKPIPLPKGVTVDINGQLVVAKQWREQTRSYGH